MTSSSNEIIHTATSEYSDIRGHSELQAIDATYYNLTDGEGRPIAGLLVLLDRLQKPVRSELHLYEDLETMVRDNAVRQAQRLLQERYYSRDPVMMRILQTYQERGAVDVQLPQVSVFPGSMARPRARGRRAPLPWVSILGVLLGVVLVAGLAWALLQMLGGDGDSTVDAPPAEAIEAPVDAAGEAVADVGPEGTSAVAGEQRNGLPPSVNARDDIGVGSRIRIIPGLQTFLLDQPDVNTGAKVGSLVDGEEATIIGGAVWKQGESDTIVWWLVRTNGGLEAWAPANTSQLTLLEPVQ